MAKRNCIFIFTFPQDVTLHGKPHGKIPERFILGVSTPSIWPASRQMCPDVGWLPKCNVSTGVSLSGKGCASFWAHLHPAFEASLPGENPKCFERKIFFQYILLKGKNVRFSGRKNYCFFLLNWIIIYLNINRNWLYAVGLLLFLFRFSLLSYERQTQTVQKKPHKVYSPLLVEWEIDCETFRIGYCLSYHSIKCF